ncbi:hypothetical protein Sjap_003692 [Stephania japonica]|uniref:Uncharacterized protein n=1 Tax=Stephania japonica TaxID=461633 RepID=A0AAP0KRC9_9MAGN
MDTLEIESLLLLVQVNQFQCGGIAIGVCGWHKIVDFSPLVTVVNGWSCGARGDSEVVAPHFALSTLLPWRVIPCDDYDHHNDQQFHTTEEQINTTDSWKDEVVVTKREELLHCRNIALIGNMISIESALFLAIESDYEYCCLVSKMRGAIRGIDGEYVKKLESGDEWHLNHLKAKFEKAGEMGSEQINFIIRCRIGLYDPNFGWGKACLGRESSTSDPQDFFNIDGYKKWRWN